MPSHSLAAALAGLAAIAVLPRCDAGGVVAMTPPRGFRTWNQFQTDISQSLVVSLAAALADRSRTVNGVPTSLADLGYANLGIDDAWQMCGSYGPKGYTYHDENGNPQVNTTRFANMTAMNQFIHSLNLTSGWYG